MHSVEATPPAPDGGPDDAIVERARAGDGAAFELLMRRHNRRLYRTARSMLRDAAEAEDALQEAYLAAYRALPAFRGDSALATWLTRIVSNECLSRIRRRTRPQVERDIPPRSIVGDAEPAARNDDLRGAACSVVHRGGKF